MLDFNYLINNLDTDECFRVALKYYNELLENNPELEDELPEGTSMENLCVNYKSVSILVKHKTIQSPSIEVCLDLTLEENLFSFGCYKLILDQEKRFIDEFLVFN